MTSQNHTITDVPLCFTILGKSKKFLCDFDDLKEKLILKMEVELYRIYMGGVGGWGGELTKVIDRI